MGISFDRFAMGARSFYEASERLHKETGLGFSTCEWLDTIARNVFPLGKNSFLAIEGMVEAHSFLKMRRPNYVYDALAADNEHKGDHWIDMSLMVDSVGELEAIASRLGGKVSPDNSAAKPYDYFRRPDGYTIGLHSAPHFARGRPVKWPRGLPTFCYYPDVPGRSSSQPVVARPHLVRAMGVKWIEFGGSEDLLSAWIGVPKASDVLPIRFNGKEVGLWAVCVGREGKEDIVIRRPTAAASIKDPSKYAKVK